MNESPAMPPEPSDAERATWPPCTTDYVEALEATAARVWDFEADWKHQREKRLAAEGARDRAQRSLRALQEGAALALSKLGASGDGPVADFLCAIHREAVRGLLASDEVTNECDAGRAALEQGGQS